MVSKKILLLITCVLVLAVAGILLINSNGKFKIEGVNPLMKQINIPLTKVFMISSENTINLPDESLIKSITGVIIYAKFKFGGRTA